MKKLYLALLMSLLVGPLGFNFVHAQTFNDNSATQQNKQISISLKAQNNSNEDGSAYFTEADNNQVKAVIQLNNQPANTSQPAQIHAGSMNNPGEVKYNLNDVTNGRSETTINTSMDNFLSQLPLSLIVHKSTNEMNTYVAAGDIQKQDTSGDVQKPDNEKDKLQISIQTLGSSSAVTVVSALQLAENASAEDIANQIAANLKVDRNAIESNLRNQEQDNYKRGMSNPSCITNMPNTFRVISTTQDNKTVVAVMIGFTVNSTDRQTVIDQTYNKLNQLSVDQLRAILQVVR